jgi:hypothetical protein
LFFQHDSKSQEYNASYIYKLIVAMDANFKMKNRIRVNGHYDPSLGPGWGAFVEPKGYWRHIRKYVSEKDVSVSGFASLYLIIFRIDQYMYRIHRIDAERYSEYGGLAGIGRGWMCLCATRVHAPEWIGRPAKGRTVGFTSYHDKHPSDANRSYANMDYIVASALRGFNLMELAISYDINCQWHKDLPGRMQRLPPKIQLALDDIRMQFGLPVWHASSHKKS